MGSVLLLVFVPSTKGSLSYFANPLLLLLATLYTYRKDVIRKVKYLNNEARVYGILICKNEYCMVRKLISDYMKQTV